MNIKVDQKFGNSVLMEPHFVFWSCTGCDADMKKHDCYGGGKYCAQESTNTNYHGYKIV